MAGEERRDTGVKSVLLAIDILEALAESRDDIGVSELALQLGTTKGTVFRHLQTLSERGYVRQNASTQRYCLGPQAVRMGEAASARIDLIALSQTTLRALREETGETAVVSVVDGRGVTVLATVLGKSTLEIGVRPGSDLVLHASAQGKVALAFSRRPFLAQLRRRGLPSLTPHTITDFERLEAELARVRAQGFASAPDEDTVGINAISAPVFDGQGEVIATVAIVGSAQYIRHEPDPAQTSAVTRAAATLSSSMGYRGPR